MANFVLVHGGGHGGWCYNKVSPLLRAAGHLVHAPSLTGCGDRKHLVSADIDLDTHITDIVNLLEYEELTNIILVGHSYGGMVITGVADRATDRVGHIVYLDAAMPQNGQSLVDVAGPLMLAAREAGSKVVNGVELVLFPGTDPLNYFGVTDPDQLAFLKPKLTPHPWKCFEQKLVLNNEAAMRKIPVSVIACTFRLDDTVRAEYRAVSDGRFWEIDTGHDLMLSEPQKTADALLAIAQG